MTERKLHGNPIGTSTSLMGILISSRAIAVGRKEVKARQIKRFRVFTQADSLSPDVARRELHSIGERRQNILQMSLGISGHLSLQTI